ncbi:hypothetical protein JHK85_003590 [Glycine max]|nr:hypothetical protein JHK85_003590 [Glycine max]KHN00679.1 hypothetical protein glysoja_000347 [Glycine soja]
MLLRRLGHYSLSPLQYKSHSFSIPSTHSTSFRIHQPSQHHVFSPVRKSLPKRAFHYASLSSPMKIPNFIRGLVRRRTSIGTKFTFASIQR